jgi:RNA polymerase sigma-70 factor (ECF subfamily)
MIDACIRERCGTGWRVDVPLDQLVADAGSGDPWARARLLAIVRPLALRYARARLRGMDEALCSPDDIAQEVCIAVLSAVSTYRPQGRSFHAFVQVITKYKIVDAHRTARRDRCAPVADPPEVPVHADGPEHRTLLVERTEYLDRLLATLSPRQRQVVTLRVLVGLSAEETARIVGGTATAVRVTQHRALNYLRQVLDLAPSR